jgi:hypothetical protein
MITKEETLIRLKKESDYEEKISDDLSNYFLECLEEVDELTYEERRELKNKLQEILEDSVKHKNMIVKLIEYVENNGKDSY